MKQLSNQFWGQLLIITYLLTSCLNPAYKHDSISPANHQKQLTEKTPSTVESIPTDPYNSLSTILSNIPCSYLITRDHHPIRFYRQGQAWIAKVKRNLPDGFKQTLLLPTHLAKDFQLPTLHQQSPYNIAPYIHICFPEQDQQTKQGYVYIDYTGLQGGAPAKTSTDLKDILVTHQGPFANTYPTNERIAVQSIQFIPQKGLWWAKITYLSYSNATHRWKTYTSPIYGPIETDTSETFYAEEIAHTQVTIDYTVQDTQANRPAPTFQQIHIQKTNLWKRNQEPLEEEEDPIDELDVAALATIQEAAYKDFVQTAQDPKRINQLISNNQQFLESILEKITPAGQDPSLKAEAQAFSAYLVQFIQVLHARHQAVQDLYWGTDTSDYINQHLEQGIQELKQLENHLQTSNYQLHLLCEVSALKKPLVHGKSLLNSETLFQPFTNQTILLEILNAILETKVPAGKLLQVILGTVDQPETWEEWLPIALETALDFLPRGKATMFKNILSGKSTKSEFKKLLIRQAKKKAQQISQESKRKQKIKAKKAEKEKCELSNR